jgi:uncharacterized protein
VKYLALCLLALALSIPAVAQDDKPLSDETKTLIEQMEEADAGAQFRLGLMFATELKNEKEAVYWYRKAADQGYAEAQWHLGVAYHGGEGVLKDHKEAVKWYRKAADQGHAWGQAFLGEMYMNGQGVLKDDKEAVKWYRKAADQGLELAQGNLGVMYEYGQGVLMDYVTAYAWYSLGAFNGNKMGQENRDKLAEKMTPEQIAKAQELSRDLLKQIEENKKKAK